MGAEVRDGGCGGNPRGGEGDPSPLGGSPHDSGVHGWVVVDKSAGIGSTPVVSRVRRLFGARKAGHAGTLDPLAEGILPVALGEATKTVPFLVAATKDYSFTVVWGSETDTGDTEGRVVARGDYRPGAEAVRAALEGFVGEIIQEPPVYSALKIAGRRACDLARQGIAATPAPRVVQVHGARLMAADDRQARISLTCGKGVYIRSIARDLGRALGVPAHVGHLRRTRVGPFCETESISLDSLAGLSHNEGDDAVRRHLRPLAAALTGIPVVGLESHNAAWMRHGRAVPSPGAAGMILAVHDGRPLAMAKGDGHSWQPVRVFNM